MIIKTKDVIGLKVISLDTGAKVEDVDDVVYDPASQKIQALIVASGGMFSSGQLIMIEDVHSIGPDAVIIPSADVLRKTSDSPEQTKRIAKEDNYLTKTNVITEEGKELGQITDLYFDTITGAVTEFEVSQGGLRNLQSGSKRIRPDHIVTVGADALIVSTYTEVAIEAQAQEGGLTGLLHHTTDKAQELAGTAKEKGQQAFATAKDKTQDTVDNAKDTWNSPETQSRIANAKQGATDLAEDAKERVQTAADTTRQRATDVKDDPDNQARWQEAKDKLQVTVDTSKDKLQSAVDTSKEALDTTKQGAQDQLDAKQQAAEQSREDGAVGQYLTQNLLGATDELLAPRGTMVTYGLLDIARAHDKTGLVLGNLSKEPLHPEA